MVSRNDGTRTWTLEWTPENMLQTAASGSDSVSLLYDADGMMVQRAENGQTTNYLGKLFQDNNGTFTKQYQFNGQLIALREGLLASSPVSFMAANQLGSTTTTLWADGTVRADQRYTPWGEERWASNATPTQYQYTSQRNDSLLGLYDYNARYYDPAIGRFISADSIVPDPVSLQAFNRYAYVENRPINLIDPSGHCPGSSGRVGNSSEENQCWALVNTISNSWNNTEYWNRRFSSLDNFMENIAANEYLGADFFTNELIYYYESMDYASWSADLYPPFSRPPFDMGDYTSVSWTVSPFGAKLIFDDYGNVFVNFHVGSMPGASLMRGYIYENDGQLTGGELTRLTELSVDQQELTSLEALPGSSGGFSGGFVGGAGISAAMGEKQHLFVESGLYSPGIAGEIGITYTVYDSITRTSPVFLNIWDQLTN